NAEYARHDAGLWISRLRSDAYDDQPAQLQNRGFVPQLVVRGSTAPAPASTGKPLPPESA
ncbi:TPA: LacI family transcriptional regulator, partial [Xanthomonas vasicola pv. zeae]|nr:LacI family transcriptional regulator [Xanthomonas vasicola pv. zeae]